MIPSGRLNGYSVNTLRDVLVSSADADSTLPSMAKAPALNAQFGARCTPGGVYASCFEQFSNDGDSLAHLDYTADFIAETEPWSGTSDCFTTRFHHPFSEQQLAVTLFGEVLDEHECTGLGAMGGSSLKRGQVRHSSSIHTSVNALHRKKLQKK